MDEVPLSFELPVVEGRVWHRAVDTVLAARESFTPPPDEVPVTTAEYLVAAQSIVILVSKPGS